MTDAMEERAKIVAWLLDQNAKWQAKVAEYRANGNPGPYLGEPSYAWMAAQIQAGEHEART